MPSKKNYQDPNDILPASKQASGNTSLRHSALDTEGIPKQQF